MPIYEYRCPECGHEFDKLQKMSDPAPECASCGHAEVVKKVSRTSFHLKGTGWYVTDYKDRPTAATSKDSGAESSSSTEDSGSSDGSGDSDSGGSSDGGGSSDSGGGGDDSSSTTTSSSTDSDAA